MDGKAGMALVWHALWVAPMILRLRLQRTVSSPRSLRGYYQVLTTRSKSLYQVLSTTQHITQNANIKPSDPSTSTLEDQTCNGGFQAYCCLGFVASQTANTGSLDLVDQSTSSKRSLEKRGLSPAVGRVCISVAELAALAIVDAAAAFFTFGASEIAFGIEAAAAAVCW